MTVRIERTVTVFPMFARCDRAHEGDAMTTFTRCDRKIARMLNAMKPGVDYTAADLAMILGSSRCEIGALMRSAVADGLVDKVGIAKTGFRNSGKGYVYRVNEDGRKE